MATVTKQWGNGDLLTLVTSAGGIAVTSAENLTGADREMTIRVQTTNQGTKAFQDVLIKQEKYAVLQDGYWVHKDTGVTTYFGADASFINNGVMSRPPWITNAKEIKLCSGISDLETEIIEEGGESLEVCLVFYTGESEYNAILESIDFSLTTLHTLYQMTLACIGVDSQSGLMAPGKLNHITLPSTLSVIEVNGIIVSASAPDDVVIENIPLLNRIGMYLEIEGTEYVTPGIINYKYHEGGSSTFILKTAQSNVNALASIIKDFGEYGASIEGNYQIIGV